MEPDHQKGMALVSTILMLAALMVLSLVLSEQVWQATRTTAFAALREQAYWAAESGLEWARHELATSYSDTQGWLTLLAAATTAGNTAPAWQRTIEGIPVEVYLRDNPDGDDDPERDYDLQLTVLVRAAHPRGPEVMIEALCEYLPGRDLGQVAHGDLAALITENTATYLAE